MLEVNQKNWDEKVLKADGVVIVDFWAPWCSQCLNMAPTLEALEREGYNVVKINTDENEPIALTYGVSTLPTLLLFSKGQVIGAIRGVQPKVVMLRTIMDLVAAYA